MEETKEVSLEGLEASKTKGGAISGPYRRGQKATADSRLNLPPMVGSRHKQQRKTETYCRREQELKDCKRNKGSKQLIWALVEQLEKRARARCHERELIAMVFEIEKGRTP
ncbi:hypothetical protein M9H77_18875 [Catharanthus roseus]|uniref:Uncharacterized protein n=1 Tax=Catharanthus roseus TaxID=4058 RepID=A0ACC0B8U5_CATRO|nr:hypothetical protein M9H77_18875 [Catharanthus roseus]